MASAVKRSSRERGEESSLFQLRGQERLGWKRLNAFHAGDGPGRRKIE